MSDPTDHSTDTLKRRQDGLEAFIEEGVVAQLDLARQLGIDEPFLIVREPHPYLNDVDRLFRDVAFEGQDRIRAIVQIGHFIAELLTSKFGGFWLVDDDPRSKYYAEYVVGR